MSSPTTPGILSRLGASLPWAGGDDAAGPDESGNARRIIRPVLALLMVGALAAFWTGIQAGALGAVAMWAVSSFAAGGTTGFLFGIPKSGIGPRAAASVSAAQAVADAAPPNSPEIVLRPLRQLGVEYETLRTTQEYSRDRTRRMAEIVNRMRPHAIAAAPYIDALIDSPSTGDHLAATIILQMNYLPERMNWLARRIVEERAFIAYQAASALLQRLKLAGVAEYSAIQEAVRSAHAQRNAALPPEPSLDRLIEQILGTR